MRDEEYYCQVKQETWLKISFPLRLAPTTLATTRGRDKLALGSESSRQHVFPRARAQWGEESGAGNSSRGPTSRGPTWAPLRW